MEFYKLVNKIQIKVEFDGAIEYRDILKKTKFGEVEVSTVFLGWNHGIGSQEPILFETMVFGGEYDGYQGGHCTYEEAERGHGKTCYMVNKIQIDRENKLDDIGI